MIKIVKKIKGTYFKRLEGEQALFKNQHEITENYFIYGNKGEKLRYL